MMMGREGFLPQPQILFNQQEIRNEVEKLAQQIKRDYQEKNPLLIGILKGSFIFMADLVRLLDIPLEIEFVTLSSYGRGRKKTSGKVKIVQGLRTAIKGRDILVVEDIVDVGLTLDFFLGYLRRKKPASLKVCALFDKPSRRQVLIPIDYVGFTVPDAFLVGYGLDYDERFRNLPGLYFLEDRD
jgi:hypoxanthine phosphoribosyltransferase